ncbi:MAG: hypothetical protein QOD83_4839 [Solirubrobacteraceae bacterium]|nr:hypothetical protein [Solirubrobacteraceae bacterium]
MRLRFVAIVAVVVGGGLPAAAVARPYEVNDLRIISGPSPFAAGCPGAALDETRIAGAEIEPAITVSPGDPRTIVATWQQDIGRGGARSDLIGASSDGGKTWKRSTIPGLSRCTGGSADVATDPWVSAGPDGSVYFSGAAIFLSSEPVPAVLVASRSRDRGRRWSPPVAFAGPSVRVEREVVTADPRRPGHAYVVWWERDPLMPFDGSTHQFARTLDGGATWSAPVTLDTAPPGALDQSAEILVMPNGSLLALIARLQLEGGGALQKLFAMRSSDQGRTWDAPVQVASQPIAPIPDPETGDALPNQDLTFHSAAIAPDGTVYVAWDRDSSATSGTIDIAKSSNGGISWSAPTALPGVTAFTFEPVIAVDARGTVGVIWYDNRNDRLGDAPRTTDVWFAHSADGGSSWSHSHVAGPFDFRTAPRPSGDLRLGEYQGLAGLSRGFAAVFTQAAPQAEDGPTDIFFAQIGPR